MVEYDPSEFFEQMRREVTGEKPQPIREPLLPPAEPDPDFRGGYRDSPRPTEQAATGRPLLCRLRLHSWGVIAYRSWRLLVQWTMLTDRWEECRRCRDRRFFPGEQPWF